MRRFIASLPGKLFSQLVILALLLPTLTFALVARASAQVATLPVWAVVEFSNRKSAGTTFGKGAAAAVTTELAKTGRYELVPPEQIQRAIEAIGVESPPKGDTNLLRLGQEVRANTLVTGEIVDYTVRSVNGNKQGLVSMLVTLRDVASGLPINGTVVTGQSSERASNTADDVLINDAIVQGASIAVRDLQSTTLPQATVQNTTTYGAFINQGARSGFKPNQQVIVTRGRQQVATARVAEVEPDSAQIRVERGVLGIQPGDKVRTIFTVPNVTPGFNNLGKANIKRDRPHGSPSGLLTVLIVLGIVALLLSSGNSGSQNAANNVRAETLNDVGFGEAGVRISWSGDAFTAGTNQRVRWLVFRSDVGDTPIMSVPGTQNYAENTTTQALTSFVYLNRVVPGGIDCVQGDSNSTAIVSRPAIGRPYNYSVSLNYRVLNIDLPDGGTTTNTTAGGTTGTTSTAGTTTTTTAGTTGSTTTNTTGGSSTTGTTATTSTTATTGTTTTGTTTGTTAGTITYCYFNSAAQSAEGPATPLQKPSLTAPGVNAELSGDQSFSFTTVGDNKYALSLEYVLEFSTSSTFDPGTWAQVGKQLITQALPADTPRAFPSIPVTGQRAAAVLGNTTLIYWRVGVRNIADRPGPVKSPNGQRYVYSAPLSFRRALTPPGGP